MKFTSLGILAAVLAMGFMRPVEIQSGAADSLAPLLPSDHEIEVARSAGPAAVANAATIYVLRRGTGFVVAQKGGNGFACLVERSRPDSFEPECFDAEGSETILPPILDAAKLREQGAREDAVSKADVVLDCSDNFATRHEINRACVRYQKPLVSGAGVRFDGQITSFDLRRADSPCYHCLFPDQPDGEEERCAIMGVFAPLVGIIGTMQAAEAIRLLSSIGEPLIGRMLMLDGKSLNWQTVRFRRDEHCAVCAPRITAKIMESKYETIPE